MERRVLKRRPERQEPRPRLELDIDLPRRRGPEEDEEDEADEKKTPRGVAIVDFFI